jgi:hypothetical protein
MKLEGDSILTDEKRFCDNGDGTVTDKETKLMWNQTDAYQDTSKWSNWFMAEDYIKSLNIKKFAGYINWRMPTLEEAEDLYDEDIHIRDMDRFEIFIDSAFSPGGGFTTWTSDERPHGTACIFYFRYGHGNMNHKEDITKDTIRAVRDID